jgi:hypothetical protein
MVKRAIRRKSTETTEIRIPVVPFPFIEDTPDVRSVLLASYRNVMQSACLKTKIVEDKMAK